MKKLVAALAAFALPALLAAWLALAPLGGDFAGLDPLAERLIALQGRTAAIFALLMMGLGFAVLAALAVRTSGPERLTYNPQTVPADFGRRHRGAPLPQADEPSAEAAEEDTPQIFFAEPEEAEPAESVQTSLPALTAAPVALVRKPRERRRDWFADASWFGGLPRLGNQRWPRDAGGTPLPFAAQIDLAELAAARPDLPLPQAGSLAFFLGAGAVVAVPAGTYDFSEPPADLPPAYEEGRQPFPARQTRLARWFFPFWPVALRPLDGVEPQDDAAIAAMLGAAPRDHPFYAAGVGAPVETLWWHSMLHLTDCLHDALEDAPRLTAQRRDELARQHAEIVRLRTDSAAMPYALEDAQEIAEQMEAEFAMLQDQAAALPDMVAALDGFVAERDPLARLTPDELAIAADVLSEVHERYGEVVRTHAPGTLAQLATISARALVSGPPEMLAALPDVILSRINRDYRLPPVHLHRMLDADDCEVVLLQLGYDDLVEWTWPETGVWRYRIDAESFLAGNWNAVRLSFEDA